MRRLLDWLRGRELDDDLREELQDHLERRAEWHERQGMDPAAARRASRLRFGNTTRAQERTRAVYVSEFAESVWQDAVCGARGLWRAPAFAAAAIVTMALGIGATTAVFGSVDRILFRGVPYPAGDRLVSLGMTAPIEPDEFMLGPDYLAWREAETPLEQITAWGGATECDINEDHPQRLTCARIEASFLDTFGVRPALGRAFTADEDAANAPVALISYGLWQSRFGGDPEAIGATIRLDGRETSIIGVLPQGFELPTLASADVAIPLGLNQQTARGANYVVRAFGRMPPGMTAAEVADAMQPLFEESLRSVPPQFVAEVRLMVRPLWKRQVEHATLSAWVLVGAVFLVLLIASANVAGLMLARAASRRRESAVRAALGGGRARLIRQGLTEALLLAIPGGAVGAALAWAVVKLLSSTAPEGMIGLAQARFDVRMLGVAFAVSAFAAMASGLAPALQRAHPEELTGSRIVTGTRQRFRRILVVAQIAATLVLLDGASLLTRSLWKLESRNTGMEAGNVVTVPLVLPRTMPAASVADYFASAQSRMARIPGVTAVAVSDSLPPSGRTQAMIYSLIEVEGEPRAPEGTGGMVVWRSVTPGYFGALGIPIRRGRGFIPADEETGEAMIVSETLARRLFGGRDPMGERVRVGGSQQWHTVIGIAADVDNAGLLGPQDPEYYVVRRQMPGAPAPRRGYLIVRATVGVADVSRWVRQELDGLDATVPVEVEPMTLRLRGLSAEERFRARVLGLFAALSLVLAGVGLLGVLWFLVSERRREIGVRMVLGASRSSVVGLVLRQAAVCLLAGVVIGLAGALAVARIAESLLVDTPATDPLSLIVAAVTMLAVVIAVSALPARSAASLDPMVVLRQQ